MLRNSTDVYFLGGEVYISIMLNFFPEAIDLVFREILSRISICAVFISETHDKLAYLIRGEAGFEGFFSSNRQAVQYLSPPNLILILNV